MAAVPKLETENLVYVEGRVHLIRRSPQSGQPVYWILVPAEDEFDQPVHVKIQGIRGLDVGDTFRGVVEPRGHYSPKLLENGRTVDDGASWYLFKDEYQSQSLGNPNIINVRGRVKHYSRDGKESSALVTLPSKDLMDYPQTVRVLGLPRAGVGDVISFTAKLGGYARFREGTTRHGEVREFDNSRQFLIFKEWINA
jgi:hypothetical protein